MCDVTFLKFSVAGTVRAMRDVTHAVHGRDPSCYMYLSET